MKIYILTFLILIFCVSNFGQINKPAVKPTPNAAGNPPQSDLSSTVKEKIADLKKQKRETEDRKNRLLLNYTELHPTVVKETEKIAALDKEILALSAGNPDSLVKSEFDAKETAVIAEISALRTQLAQCVYSRLKECADGSIKGKLSQAYQKALNYPKVVMFLFEETIENTGTRPAPVNNSNEQNAELLKILITQNQQIITLLEKLTNKK